MPLQEKDFDKIIADQLRDAGIKFDKQKALAGLAPDFIVYAPDGRQFIVEIKNWDFPGSTAEASRQVQHYQQAVKADGVFLVIPSLKRNLPAKGVFTLDGLLPALRAELETTKTRSNPPEATNIDKLVFGRGKRRRKRRKKKHHRFHRVEKYAPPDYRVSAIAASHPE